MNLPVGTPVSTPPIHGAPVETVTASPPFRWANMVLVALVGLPGLWETRVLALR